MSSEIPQITNLYKQVQNACATTTNEFYQYQKTIEVYQTNFNILIIEINKLRAEINKLQAEINKLQRLNNSENPN